LFFEIIEKNHFGPNVRNGRLVNTESVRVWCSYCYGWNHWNVSDKKPRVSTSM